MCGTDLFLCLLAVLFPPIAVWVKRGVFTADSIINIALCCLGFFPGLVHAWYIVAKYQDRTYDHHYHHNQQHHYSLLGGGDDGDNRQGRGVTYYYVRSDAHAQQHPYPHPLHGTNFVPGSGSAAGADGGSGFGGYGTIGVASPAPLPPDGAGGMGGQFPSQQQGKINPYAAGGAGGACGDGKGGGAGQIPDGHLRVVVHTLGEDGSGAGDASGAGVSEEDGYDGGARAPPSYTDVVKGDHKIQRD